LSERQVNTRYAEKDQVSEGTLVFSLLGIAAMVMVGTMLALLVVIGYLAAVPWLIPRLRL